MPDACCAVRCQSRRGKGDKNLSFYHILLISGSAEKSVWKSWVSILK